MNKKVITYSGLFKLTTDIIDCNLKKILRDDSIGKNFLSIISNTDFKPESFTIGERIRNSVSISTNENNFNDFVYDMVKYELNMLENENIIRFTDLDRILSFILKQINSFLSHKIGSSTVADLIYNQEFPDIVATIIGFCLMGDFDNEFYVYKTINSTLKNISTRIIKNRFIDKKDLKYLLCFAVGSGLIGLNLKSKSSASSSFASRGIYVDFSDLNQIDSIANDVFNKMDRLIEQNALTVDYYDEFLTEIKTKPNFYLVFFSDDYNESIFDLFFLQELLMKYNNITISCIPKNGRYGNDINFDDVRDFLNLDIFTPLRYFFNEKRFQLISNGPRMGAANIKKFAPNVVLEIEKCDAVLIKGCRTHEMLQGGLKKTIYTSMVVTREFTERELGFDGRNTPFIFCKSEPLEYMYWGFNGHNKRIKKFDDGRKIRLCLSTLLEHEERKKIKNFKSYYKELKKMLNLKPHVLKSSLTAYKQELILVLELFLKTMRESRNQIFIPEKILKFDNQNLNIIKIEDLIELSKSILDVLNSHIKNNIIV